MTTISTPGQGTPERYYDLWCRVDYGNNGGLREGTPEADLANALMWITGNVTHLRIVQYDDDGQETGRFDWIAETSNEWPVFRDWLIRSIT